MNIINYAVEAKKLIIEQLKKQFGPDNTLSGGAKNGQTVVATVTFPRYSYTSTVIPFAVINAPFIKAYWTENQENKGQLIYDTEFIVIGNRIQLTNGSGNTVNWLSTVQANALGLLSVTVMQEN